MTVRRLAPGAMLALSACAAPRVATEPVSSPRLMPATAAVPAASLAAAVTDDPALATLSRLVTAAGLSPLLAGPGPLTLFAPTDAAWARLAPGNVDALLRPDARPTLVKLLCHHLIAGTWTSAALRTRVAAGQGTLTTLAGEPLTVGVVGRTLVLSDAAGDRSYVEAERATGNGTVLRVNGVVLPHLHG